MNGSRNRKGEHGIKFVDAPRRLSHEEENETLHSTPEKELRESELKYRTLVETLPHAIIIIQEGTIVFANTTAAEALGFDRGEDLIGRCPLEFVAEHEKERLRDYLHRRSRGESGVPEHYETVLCSRDGHKLHAEIRVKTLSFKGRIAAQLVVTDITSRRQYETQMRLLMQALEKTVDGIALIDPDERVTFSNHSFASVHGYSPGELVGKHVSVLHPASDLLTAVAANAETLRVGGFSGDLVHLRKDGKYLSVFRTSTLVRNDQGSPSGMILTIRDISETKISEKVIRHSEEKNSRRSCNLEKRLLETAEQLGDSQSELREYAKRLKQANEALKMVISEIENLNRERERTVYHNVNANVLTIVDQLKIESLPDSARLLLNVLELNLKSLFSPPAPILPMEHGHLTNQETRLCELIRAGLTSKQIAEVLGISPATVVVHRANIRTKLGLVGSADNLATYLRSRL